MFYKIYDNKYFTVLIYIFLSSIYNIKAEKSIVNIPSWFLKNQGQFSNGSQYCLKTGKSNTFFFENYIVHQFVSVKDKQDSINPDILNMRIDFENSTPHPVFEERDPLASKSNFFIGNDASSWRTDIASFSTLAYKGLYDNVDLVYYNATKGIKSDFVVHTGGNISDILLKYSGIKDISINAAGALQLYTDAGEITENIPEAYQLINGTKVIVNVNFRIDSENTVRFDVENYNQDYDLVIDPQLIYCSYLGGISDDYMYSGDIERDASNNIYFTCRTNSFDFPVSPGSYTSTPTGTMDAFVMKMNPDGTQIIFSTFIGGTGVDAGFGLELSGPGNDIIVIGDASSTFPTTPGAYQTTYQGGSCDIFLFKLNNAGNKLIFSTFLGGPLEDQPFDFAIDNNHDMYIVGQTNGSYPTTVGSYQTNYGGGSYDILISKMNSDGSALLNSTYLGGASADRGVGITVGQTGDVYVSGWTSGDFPTTSGCFDNTFNGGTFDIIVAKFNSTLSSLIYSTFIGTGAEDQVRGDIFVDNSNNLIVLGKAGNGFPTTAGCFQPSYGGGLSDGLILKLNSTGTKLIYASYLGGTGDDYILNAVIDANSNIIATGFCGSGFPVTSCAYDESYNGSTDTFITKTNPDISKLLYSSYFGGNNIDNGMALVTSNDTVTMIGETQSPNLPTTNNSYDATFNGQIDIFLVKLYLGSGEIPVAKFTNSSISCVNQSINFSNGSLNGTTYYWNFGDGYSSAVESPSHPYSQSSNYLVSLIALNACGSDTTSNSIIINGSISTNTVSICSGDSILINGLYRNNQGKYNETYPTSSGCDSIITTNLTVNPAFLTTQSHAICQGETFIVGTQIYLTSGSYTNLLTAVTGCDSIVKTNLTVNPLPTPSLGNDTLMCPGDLIVLTPGFGFTSYLWSEGSVLSTLQVNQAGRYFVTVSDGFCSARDTISISDCGSQLWFPNVFTPNNDGVNERFRPVSQGVITFYQILIFNRWGQQLYESNDGYTGWDGTFQGNQCPSGAYFYISEYSVGMGSSLQKQTTKRGSVTLLR